MNGIVRADEILNLYRIEVLAAADNYVFLAVNQIIEAVLILHRHVSGKKPAIF